MPRVQQILARAAHLVLTSAQRRIDEALPKTLFSNVRKR